MMTCPKGAAVIVPVKAVIYNPLSILDHFLRDLCTK